MQRSAAGRDPPVGLRTVDLTAQDAYIDCPTGSSAPGPATRWCTRPSTWSPTRTGGWPAGIRAWPPSPARTGCCRWRWPATSSTAPPPPSRTGRCTGSGRYRNLWWWAGDRDEVAALLPVAEGVLRWFAEFARDGLLTDVTGWVLLDWASVQGRGAGAVLNGLWGRALTDFAEMAACRRPRPARWARAQHRRLAEAYRIFFDPERGGYRDWARDGVAARASATTPPRRQSSAASSRPRRGPRCCGSRWRGRTG
ncbi:hypothetical protein V2I01_41745 [Micromonospora sp. BRA006-A]|nr:hypothetical protein [Micromonospora sp. BRA006-A]